jgi:hypothetical protein
MRSLAFALLLAAAACRAGQPASPSEAASPGAGASYEAHMAEATRLEDEATRHEEAAEVARQRGPTYQCDTAPEHEMATSGTENLADGTRNCSDVAQDDQRRHDGEAKKLREEARRQRGMARSLLDTERKACAGYDVERVRDTPLGRARAAARVEDIDGGVRIAVTAGPGLALEEVRRELACHRARAALYDADGYMAHDPALVPATRVSVDAGSGGGLVFTIRGDDPVATDVARKRASALVTAL